MESQLKKEASRRQDFDEIPPDQAIEADPVSETGVKTKKQKLKINAGITAGGNKKKQDSSNMENSSVKMINNPVKSARREALKKKLKEESAR